VSQRQAAPAAWVQATGAHPETGQRSSQSPVDCMCVCVCVCDE
jgi:hypothetical protein